MMRGFTDINLLYKKTYEGNPELKRIVLTHSEQVARKALAIRKAKNLELDPKQIYCAAMLHDIGVVKCNAPDIFARGNLPYICHGLEGEKILKQNGLMMFAGVCRNHTGAGISKEEIIENNLPLPPEDMLPQNELEELICYADKFFSKSKDLKKEKTPEEVIAQIGRFGEKPLARFMEMHKKFEV